MLSTVLLVVSVIVFLFACLCLLVPGLRLKTVLVWAVAVVLLSVACDDAPPPTVITNEQRDRNIERQREQRAEELGTSVDEVLALEARERAEADARRDAEQERMRRLQREPASGQREESIARQQMRLVRGRVGLGDPIGPMLAQIPSSPRRSQLGEDRTFTYTFGDGSRLILGARPGGDQAGLVLWYVDVED